VNKEDCIRFAYNRGFFYQGRYRGCAQSTVAAIQDALEIHNDIVFKSASGLGGEVGKHGDGSCGAYSVSVMMFGSLWGRSREKFCEERENLELTTTNAQVSLRMLSPGLWRLFSMRWSQKGYCWSI